MTVSSPVGFESESCVCCSKSSNTTWKCEGREREDVWKYTDMGTCSVNITAHSSEPRSLQPRSGKPVRGNLPVEVGPCVVHVALVATAINPQN